MADEITFLRQKCHLVTIWTNDCMLVIKLIMSGSLHSTSRNPSSLLPSLPRRSPRSSLITLLKESSAVSLRTFRAVNELVLLLQKLPFFAEFPHNYKLLSELAQCVEYSHRNPQELIYRIRERADYFYILIDGKVQLTVPEEIGLVEQEGGEYLEQQQIFPGFFQVLQDKQPNAKDEQRPQEEPIQREFVQKILRVIEQGGCFGQILGETSLRATNAFAVEECYLLTISRKAYDCLLKAQLRTDNRSKFLFLSSIPQLKPLHPLPLETIALSLQERTLSYGQSLFQEGEIIRSIFIVQMGEFKLTKTVAKHSACGLQRRTRGRSQYQCISLPTKDAPFVVVQPGEVLGDGEVLALQQVYQQRCVCESQTAKVYAIDKREYFKALTGDREAFERSRKAIEEKFKRRCAFAQSFLQRRSKQSPMNILLNSNEWASKPREFVVRDPSLNSSVSSLTSQQILANDSFFLNSLNRTFAQQQKPQGNHFSINKQKCRTEAASPQGPPLIRSKKKDGLGVPHCVQDIVSIVKLKANFLRRFRKERRRQRNVFKFDKDAVPLFVKSKYNKIQDSK